MITNDTIVSIATASGIGAISIVRLSGKDALKIGLSISKKESLIPRYATLSKIYDKKNELIDESLIIFFKNPHSFTGEDIIEFQSHGGIAISNLIIDTCLYFGARMATAGEFSKRAFLNNKIDLTQAQAISKIIEAKSENAVKLLARQLKGELKDFVNNIREDLLFILAYTEVNIDYAEEDLPQDIFEQINLKLENITTKLDEALEVSKSRDGLIDGFKIAIIGKPNVGKSSLLNKLLNFNRAIVTDIEGTTRDTIEENINIGTHIVKFVDTAGIRKTSNEIEKLGIEKSIEVSQEADIILALFDANREIDENDKKILTILEETEKDVIIIVNKIDLSLNLDLKVFKNRRILKLSTKNNISILNKELQSILDKNNCNDNNIVLISKQQVIEVEETLKHIRDAKTPLKSGELEFFAYHINEALKHISNITKPYEHTQMLDIMFGQFCLGK